MLYGLGMLTDATSEAIIVGSSHQQYKLSIVASEIAIEVGKASCEVSTLPDAIGEMSMKESEVIPSLRGEVIGDGKGLQEMRWSIEPTEDL